MLTVPDGVVVDVQVTIKTTEVYVELLQKASPWNDYVLDLELSSEEFVRSASEVTSRAPSTEEFEEDLATIEEGSADDEILDKYDTKVVEYKPIESDPILEEPGYLAAPSSQNSVTEPFYTLIPWQIGALVLLLLCIIIVRYELKKHSK